MEGTFGNAPSKENLHQAKNMDDMQEETKASSTKETEDNIVDEALVVDPVVLADLATAPKPNDKNDLTTPATILSRPAKRARTAYFLFGEEKRKQVQEELPGQGVAAVAKRLGALWSQLTDEEKKVYQEKAQVEKDRLVEELQAWKDAGGELVEEELLPGNSNSSSNGGLIFPVARIRKICKLDPDVRGLSKEAIMLVTKAAEEFCAKIGTETMRVASVQNRRKLQAGDVAQVCASREQFMFLREDLNDLSRQQTKEKALEKADLKSQQTATNKPPPFSGKPLTSYFGVKSK
ncbi:hypothetical protein MPSEU_000541200 [Mayamaea pseudoterrestris]|nr:hypothetical protein MPSEU_000541200 [Mayamaea pseudoterrestris]